MHQWLAQWEDAGGNVVAYVLQYRQPHTHIVANPDNLWVGASYFRAAQVRAMQREVR